MTDDAHPQSFSLPFDHGLVGARLIWRHWTKHHSAARHEGFLQEYSPSGRHVRISEAPFTSGDWEDTASVLVIEVLERCCVQRLQELEAKARAAAEAKRKRPRKSDQEDAA